MSLIRKLLNALERLAVATNCALLLLVTIVLFIQVFTRYVLSSSTPWSEELARYSIVWLTLLGMGVVVRRKEDIRIDILEVYALKSRVPRVVIGLLVKALEILFMIVLLRSALRIIPAARVQTITGLRVPMSYVYWSFVVGPLLALPFLFERTVTLFLGDIDSPRSESDLNAGEDRGDA